MTPSGSNGGGGPYCPPPHPRDGPKKPTLGRVNVFQAHVIYFEFYFYYFTRNRRSNTTLLYERREREMPHTEQYWGATRGISAPALRPFFDFRFALQATLLPLQRSDNPRRSVLQPFLVFPLCAPTPTSCSAPRSSQLGQNTSVPPLFHSNF